MFRENGIRVGKVFGIPIILQPSIIFLIPFYAWLLWGEVVDVTNDHSVFAILCVLATTGLSFGSVLGHEIGHALMARVHGIKTHLISLNLLGGITLTESDVKRPSQELLIAAAGPAVSLLLAGVFGGLLYVTSGWAAPVVEVCLKSLAVLNVILGLFNLLFFGFPLDGGYVTRSTIWGLTGNYLIATRIASAIGVFLGAAIGGLGGVLLVMGNLGGLFYMVLGPVLMGMARRSQQGSAQEFAFNTLRVRDLMRPVQAVVPSHISVRDVVRHFVTQLHGDQFPVVRGSELLGYISADEIAALEKSRWDRMSAESITRPYPVENFLTPGSSLRVAYARLVETGLSVLPVLEGMQLCGFVSLRDLQRRLGGNGRGGGFPA
ncbi:CBS domain-containing protein [Candidatus Sumerlaeota bacterium]|nr:CBS domain-containing protein [Candidatus Sumerlaeota bacterium]